MSHDTGHPEHYSYDPELGHGLPHDPFKAIVAPRVIGWISSCSASGQVNLAPYSFFGAFASSPHQVIGFSSDGCKDTLRNIEETGEFVWNLTSRNLASQMNLSSVPATPEVNEFKLAGLTEAPGAQVRVPHVLGAPAALECRLLKVVRLDGLDGKDLNHWIVFGQVVYVHIRREFLKDGRFDLHAAQPVLRAGYLGDYAVIGEMFEMFRPES